MKALAVYQSLRGIDRINARKRILSLAGLKLNRSLTDVLGVDPDTAGAELSDEADAFVSAAIRDWWAQASLYQISKILDFGGPARVNREREIAILLCAESVSSADDDQRTANCRRVRMQFVIGSASESEREQAIGAGGWAAYSCGASNAALRSSAYAAVNITVYSAVADVETHARLMANSAPVPNILASAFRKLYPDPSRLDWRDALTRWDTTVSETRDAMLAFGATKP